MLFILLLVSPVSIQAQQKQLFYLGQFQINPTFNVSIGDGFVFLATFPGIHVMDYSDPTLPVSAGFIGQSDFTTALLSENGYLYTSGGYNGHFEIISTASLPTLNLIGATLDVHGTSYQMVKKNNLIYFTSNSDSLYIVDVSVNTSPVVVWRSALTSFTKGLAIRNSTLYLGSASGLLLYDITTPASPSQISSLPGAFENLVVDTLLLRLYAYHAGGISVYDISNETLPAFYQQYNSVISGPTVSPLAVSGTELYRLGGGAIEVFDGASSNPNPVDDYNLGYQVNGVAAIDSLVFVSGVNGLAIFKYGYIDPAGIKDEPGVFNPVRIFPNPFNDLVNLEFTSDKYNTGNEFSLRIVDLSGKVQMQTTIYPAANITELLDLTVLSSGMYFMEVFNSKTYLGTSKLIKK